MQRKSFGIIALEDSKGICRFAEQWNQLLKKKHNSTDSDLCLLVETGERPENVCSEQFQKQFTAVVYACPNSICRMSTEVRELVQTSNNVVRRRLKDGNRLS